MAAISIGLLQVLLCRNLYAVNNADQTIATLANELESGDLETAAKRFPDSNSQYVVKHLDAMKRKKLAVGFRAAKLKRTANDELTYETFWVEEDGSKTPEEFDIAKDVHGNWLITNW